MTSRNPFNVDPVRSFEKRLRIIKGSEYKATADIRGTRIETKNGEVPEDMSSCSLDDLVVLIGASSQDLKIKSRIDLPTAGWDLSNDFVVLLEYLGIEPEEFHEVGSADMQVPIKFDFEEEDYVIDFSEMRGSILESDE